MQPLHRKRGRRPIILLRIIGQDMPDLSRRALWAKARVWIALVDADLMDKAPRVRGNRWPLPLPVMHQLGKAARSDAEVLWLARQALTLREQGWTARQLVLRREGASVEERERNRAAAKSETILSVNAGAVLNRQIELRFAPLV